MSGATDAKAELHRDVGAYGLDPLGYVRFAFPWGVPGTPLATDGGPEDWQCEVLQQLGQGLASLAEAVRLAVASGHGVGKSALVSWIILWALSTMHDTRGVVSANTEAQLRTKTWPELAKWHGARHQSRLVRLHRDGAAFGAARQGSHLARRLHHLVGEQHRGHRRPAQQGPPRLRPARRGLGHPRCGVGDHRGRADRRRHRALLVRLRQSHAQHRPLPRMLRRRPLRPSLAPSPDRFALGRHDQQGADRAVGEGLRRGVRLRPRAREGRLPARRLHAVHRRRARRQPRSPASWCRIPRRRW